MENVKQSFWWIFIGVAAIIITALIILIIDERRKQNWNENVSETIEINDTNKIWDDVIDLFN